MSESSQRQSRKNFEFCSHKNCTLTISTIKKIRALIAATVLEINVSWICILQDKIHQVINDIRDINTGAKSIKAKLHMYKDIPNTSHNPGSGSVRLSGKNHHPELDLLMFGEDPEEPPLEPSDSAGLTTLRDDTSDLSSSTSPTGRRYTQSNPPLEMTTNWPEEEERGEI